MSKGWFSSGGSISAIGVSDAGAAGAAVGGASRQLPGMKER